MEEVNHDGIKNLLLLERLLPTVPCGACRTQDLKNVSVSAKK